MALDLIQRLLAGPVVTVPQPDDQDMAVNYRDKQTGRGAGNDFVINILGGVPDPVTDIDGTIIANHDLGPINFHLSLRLNGIVLLDNIFAGPTAFGGGQTCPVANGFPPDQISFTINQTAFRNAINNALDVQLLEVHFNNINNLETACGGLNDIELNLDYIGNNRNPGAGPSFIEWQIFNESLVNGAGQLTRGDYMEFGWDYVTASFVGWHHDELRKRTISGFSGIVLTDVDGAEVGCLVMQTTGEVGGAITSWAVNGSCLQA